MTRFGSLFAACSIGILLSSGVAAHTKARAAKEIVRIQGTVIAPDAECARGLVALRALNRDIRLCDGEVRRIAVTTVETAEEQGLPTTFEVQGERERLAPLTAASAGHRVTVLGEWRPGRRDLFLIALDLCPCDSPGPDN